MDIVDLGLVAARRWYATVPALVLVGAAAFWTGEATRPECTSTASVSVLPPSTGVGTHPANPWLVYGTHELVSVARLTIDDSAYRDQLADSGLDGGYAVTADPGSPNLLRFASTSSDCQQAMSTTAKLIEDIKAVTLRQQIGYGLGSGEMMQVRVKADGKAVTYGEANVRRAQIAVGAVTLLALLLLIVALDGVLVRRRLRLRQLPVDESLSPAPAEKPLSVQVGGGLIDELQWRSSTHTETPTLPPVLPDNHQPARSETIVMPLSAPSRRTERS